MHEIKYPEGTVYERPRSTSKWIRFYSPDGRLIRKSTGTSDPDQAYEVLKREHHFAHSLTFREAVVDFFKVKGRQLKPSSLEGYRSTLRVVDPFFGKSTLSDINLTLIKAFVRSRREHVSDATIRRNLAFVSTVLTHASASIPGAPDHNPCLKLPKGMFAVGRRTRWLTPAEYNRLLSCCLNDQHRLIIQMAVGTGMRHGELRALRQHMIDFDKREISLAGELTKNGQHRFVPMSRELSDTLKRHCETAPDDLVFSHWSAELDRFEPYSTFQKFFDGARRRAKLNGVRIHDLRHTFASWWVQKGGNLHALRDILGHRSLAMVERYAHMNTEATHRAFLDVYPDTPETQSGK
jgi:integrase